MEDKLIYFCVILFCIILISGNFLYSEIKLGKENTENIFLDDNEIDFNSLTLKQKIAQMIIVRGDRSDENFCNLNVGGIFLDRQESLEEYSDIIEEYQNCSKIILFVSTDFEGAWSPFIKANVSEEEFPRFSDINSSEEAYEIGLKQGELLKEIGFNINFAPVAEFSDLAYGGRVFTGTDGEIKEKLREFIKGLQENVFGVCKHYPGKGMIENTHLFFNMQRITSEDLELFEICFEENISGIMIGHQIVNGIIDSNEKQSSVSQEVIDTIGNSSLIISDEININGLKLSYLLNKEKSYIYLINAGENVVLDFSINPRELNRLLDLLEKRVENGEIDEEKINNSCIKILEKKGYKINFF